MLVRYGMAAILAALATLMGNVVWAQNAIYFNGEIVQSSSPCETKGKCCAAKGCCAASECCKDGKCCKDGACCCKNKKCDANCTCCKDNKCECGKGGECCCKDGKCCCKDKTNVTKTKPASCPFLRKLAKSTTIIMVMPSSLPLLGVCHPEMMGMLPHPPMPMGPQVMMPVPIPPPPMLSPPGLPMPNMGSPIMPSQTVAFPNPIPAPPSCHPCPAQSVVLPAPWEANPPMKEESAALDTCLSLLELAGELCSIARPLSAPSLCASGLGVLMERMSPIGYAQTPTPYGMQLPQCTPPAPSLPQPRVLGYPTTPVGTATQQCCPSAYPSGHGGYGGYGGCSTGAVCSPPCPTTVESLPVMPCAIATPATAAKVRIIATAYSDQLEMNVGDATCIRCKKMTVTIGENEITLSRFDDRVRVRGEELKATAASVRSDRKDHLILEGDVVLHYKKDGHSANVTGDRVELNLSSGAVTIKRAAKTTVRPAARIDGVDTDE